MSDIFGSLGTHGHPQSDITDITDDLTTLTDDVADRVLIGSAKVGYRFSYSFAVDGGGAGTIPLRGATVSQLPDNFILTGAVLDVLTALGSAGAAVAAVTTGQGAGDLVVATVVAGAPFSTGGIKATAALLTAVTAIKMTAARTPALVVTIADLNAGVLDLFVEGFQGV